MDFLTVVGIVLFVGIVWYLLKRKKRTGSAPSDPTDPTTPGEPGEPRLPRERDNRIER